MVAIASFSLAATLVSLSLLWRTETSFDGPYFNRNSNAVWVGHRWVGEEVGDGETADLVRLLAEHGIKYLYVHVGPLEADGTIPQTRYRNARRFTRVVKEVEPEMVLLAWIGQVEKAGGGALDLSDANVRDNIAQDATIFAGRMGFDGIHYDIEPILDGNRDYLELLDSTKRATGNSFVSVAAHKWVPDAFLPPLIRLVYKPGAMWTDAYFKEIDKHVDQIAVMSYDTATPWASAYTLFVKFQTSSILDAVSSSEVLIGVPTYHQPTWGHSPEAENMETGLKGVIAGLNSGGRIDNFAGVAIYPLWETSDEDWQVYRRLWLGRD